METTTANKWETPKPVDTLSMVFGAAGRLSEYLPAWDEIPDEFKRHSNPWCKKASLLFFEGGKLPKVKDGVDANVAVRHLQTVLGSFDPKHEHKEAGAAYLLSLWCESPE